MTVDRSRLPAPAPALTFAFPPIEKSVLPSGLRVWTVRHTEVPVISYTMLVRRGAAGDPGDRPGLAAVTADMLDEGSGGRSAIEMHEAIARIGGQFDTDVGSDAIALTLGSLSRFSERGLALLADIVARPALADADFARVRQLRLHRLMQLRDIPGAIAERAFAKLLYGNHPYGHTPVGETPSLTAMTVDDVRAFHARELRPAAATLVAVGDCDHDAIRRMVERAFAGWDGAPGAEPVDAALPAPGRLNVVHRRGAPQSELRIGHVSTSRATPDYHALVAMNMVLGGQFVSRINLNLREDKGYTYGARTAFDFRRLSGPFSLQVSVQTSATADAVRESIGEVLAIRGPRPASAEELALGVAALTRGYARNFETADQIARAATQLALYDLPDDYFAQYVPAIERVTTADVTRVAAHYLDPARLTTLIVGDLEAIGSTLPSIGLGDPVVLDGGF